MRYAVVIEKTRANYSAYVPDLPGCVASARTRTGVLRLIRSAIEMHVSGMIEDGLRVPRPSARAEYVQATKPRRRAG